MELLRIDPQNNEAFFKKDNDWMPITSVERDDLVDLIDLVAKEDSVGLDECTQTLFIKDDTARTIYENIYKVLKDLSDNREEYTKEYREEFEACKEKYGL